MTVWLAVTATFLCICIVFAIAFLFALGSKADTLMATLVEFGRQGDRQLAQVGGYTERIERAQREGADRIEQSIREHTVALRLVAEQTEASTKALKGYAEAISMVGQYHAGTLKLAEVQVEAATSLSRSAQLLGSALGQSHTPRSKGIQVPDDQEAALAESELLEANLSGLRERWLADQDG